MQVRKSPSRVTERNSFVNRFTRLPFALLVLLAGCLTNAAVKNNAPNAPFLLGLPAIPSPKEDPDSPERVK